MFIVRDDRLLVGTVGIHQWVADEAGKVDIL